MGNEPLNTNNLYLTIDQGGHSSRAIVFNTFGEQVAFARHLVDEKTTGPDRVEQDPELLLASIVDSVKSVIEQLGERASHIVAAGLATQRSSMVCWHKQTGQALYPVISWQDRRAAKFLDKLQDQAEMIHKKTGLFLSPHFGASKMRWCLDEVPAVSDAHKQGQLIMGPLASFLIFRLLDEKPVLADPANASRTQLWNLVDKDWDPELLDIFGVPKSCLPVCVSTRYAFGTLTVDSFKIPMKIVNGDQSAALFSYGPLQADNAYITIGTGAFVSRSSGYYALYGRRLLAGIVMQEQDKSTYVLEGTVNGAGSALDWIKSELKLEKFTDKLPAWLAASKNPPIFLNGVSGLGAPYWVSDFDSQFIGDGTDEEKVVAVIESIIFLLETNLREMLKLASPPLQIQISGGFSKLDGLCQRLSDLSGLPVYRPVEQEATARGTAFLLVNAKHHWPEGEIGVWFKPKKNEALKKRYQEWESYLLTAIREQ